MEKRLAVFQVRMNYGLEGWIGGMDWRDGLEGWIGGMDWRDGLEGWIGGID
jgi:hypothetical protein